METSRRLLAIVVGTLALIAISATPALAQTPVDPSATPVKNTGGWVWDMALLLTLLGVALVIFLAVMYMRYAPRFARDEEGLKVVHADRVRPGEDLPRRAVDISQAAPIVVAPPAVPVAAVAAPASTAAPAVAPPQPVAAPAAAPPVAPAPAPAAEAPAPAAAPAPGPAAAPAPAPAAPTEHVEVTMDQETYDATLAELLEKGTDRRVAEGQARRAGMIAARKKAAGG